ncbi:MAG: nucleotidyltransferase substrate binding protein [Spiroplasmataceae bacterium]|nr:nucleotidyltransferase substrate binding protein [Spiroplasmataceae bacterium]
MNRIIKEKFVILNNIDIQPLISTRDFLQEAIASNPKTRLEIAGTVQAFEVCYELAWKTMKKILFNKGIIVNSPKETFRQAGLENLIDDSETWFDYLVKRNITVHSYEDDILDTIFPIIPNFLKDLNKLIENLKNLSN